MDNIRVDDVESGYRALALAIVKQAIEDYSHLQKKNIVSYNSRETGRFSKYEIIGFLRSGWCEKLLKGIGGHISGAEILSQIKGREPLSKKIAAISPSTGEIISTFERLDDCVAFSNATKSNICQCLRGKRHRAGGYAWKYIDNE